MTSFEQILQAALGRDKNSSLPAKTKVDVVSKGIDLQGSIELRMESDISEEDISDKAFQAASKRIDDIIAGVISQDVTDGNFYTRVTKTKVTGTVDIPTKISGLQGSDGKFLSAINLSRILNVTLFQHVKNQMGAPALVNRTGRFAHSAHVTGITGTLGTSGQSNTRGSVFFSYMLMPYAVFAGHPTRDPAKLIRKALSEALRKALTPASFKRASFNIEERA